MEHIQISKLSAVIFLVVEFGSLYNGILQNF